MVINIKMCRFDNVPWGFRLVGGADFEIPLTVVKVTEGSLAEEAGLKLDDVIVRINDEPTSPMTHDEAHRVISGCGNVFFLGIQREEEETDTRKFFPIIGNPEPIRSPTPESITDSTIQNKIDELSRSPAPSLEEQTEIDKLVEEPSNPAEDQEIANLLSAEAEVLNEHNVVGVNLHRIFPKPGVCNSSEVLRELNAEAIKTKQEKDMEKKKWTTFMQKPNRPIPKSKAQLEAEARAANAYKVKIVKNYKKPEPVRPPTPIPESPPEVIEPAKLETPPPEIEEEPPTDTEVPNLEPVEEAEVVAPEEAPTEIVEEKESKANETENIREESVANEERVVESVDRERKSPSETRSLREKTEEELQLEQQLAQVQQQLLALANLPSTIQSTLDAVTKQLSELLPTFKLQTKISKEATPEINEEAKGEATSEETKEVTTNEKEILETDEKNVETVETVETITTEVSQSYHEETTVRIETETKQEVTVQEVETSHRNIEEEQMEEEQNLKRKKVWQFLQAVQQNLSSPRPKWPIPLINFEDNSRDMLPNELGSINGA